MFKLWIGYSAPFVSTSHAFISLHSSLRMIFIRKQVHETPIVSKHSFPKANIDMCQGDTTSTSCLLVRGSLKHEIGAQNRQDPGNPFDTEVSCDPPQYARLIL